MTLAEQVAAPFSGDGYAARLDDGRTVADLARAAGATVAARFGSATKYLFSDGSALVHHNTTFGGRWGHALAPDDSRCVCVASCPPMPWRVRCDHPHCAPRHHSQCPLNDGDQLADFDPARDAWRPEVSR